MEYRGYSEVRKCKQCGDIILNYCCENENCMSNYNHHVNPYEIAEFIKTLNTFNPSEKESFIRATFQYYAKEGYKSAIRKCQDYRK